MNTPHKHAELIKAWADGAEIQIRVLQSGYWADSTPPAWREDREYRIKPAEKVVRWLWTEVSAVGARLTDYFYTDEEARKELTNAVKLEFTRTEFDE